MVRSGASCRCHTLPACLGAHTVANCWLQPQLHQTASEGRYCGARTFAAFSPMAPALPHTTKQCTRARRRPLLRLLPAEAQPRLCRSPLAAFCTETVQGTPWHRSRYPKQTVASNFQGTPNLYVDGAVPFPKLTLAWDSQANRVFSLGEILPSSKSRQPGEKPRKASCKSAWGGAWGRGELGGDVMAEMSPHAAAGPSTPSNGTSVDN